MSVIAANPYTLITDSAAVVAALADLRRQSEPLRLHAAARGYAHRVALTEICDEPPRLVWRVDGPCHSPPIGAGDELALEAHCRAGYLVSSAMRCDWVRRDDQAGRLLLRTRVPKRLSLRQSRHDWRARVVPDEMRVEARLARPGEKPVHGQLIDLSVGGCRLALAAGAAPIDFDEPVNLRLVFPNGQAWIFGARVGESVAHADTSSEAGLIFAGLSDEQVRRLWFLTCEIDRESERRRQRRGELRPLAASPLFESFPA